MTTPQQAGAHDGAKPTYMIYSSAIMPAVRIPMS